MAAAGSLPQTARRERGSYLSLARDATFLRYCLSQALTLGGLLTFVFGMPAVLVHALGGQMRDFIVMQACGIAGFMLSANWSGHAVGRIGAERLIAAELSSWPPRRSRSSATRRAAAATRW